MSLLSGGLHHLAIRTTDLGRAKRFYTETMGTKPTPSTMRACCVVSTALLTSWGRDRQCPTPPSTREFDGIMVPTRRRVCVRNPDGSPARESVSIVIDITDVAFS
jgi:hypothetical protein